jgi:ADP-ribose pyrophosphatase YjhB (NUDIX family)
MPQIEIAVIVMKDAVNVLIVKPVNGPQNSTAAGQWTIPTGVVLEGEKLIVAAERVLKEQTGLSTIPKRILFPVEIVEPGQTHQVVLVGFSECASSGDPVPTENLLTDAIFVDPRKLGEYQNEGMTLLAAQSFANFSMILMQQAQAATKSGIV